MKCYHVAIIGGGLHGLAIAAALQNNRIRNFVIVDPLPLGYGWKTASLEMGMKNLRSPWLHHLEGTDLRLMEFAFRKDQQAAAQPTPPLKLFHEHMDDVICRHRLAERHIQSEALGWSRVEPMCFRKGYYELRLSGDQLISATNVVLALGQGPAYMPAIRGINHPNIVHSTTIRPNNENYADKNVLIVGGGLTAATLAVRLYDAGASVTMAIRRNKVVSPYDFDPQWFAGSLYREFLRWDWKKRHYALKNNERGSFTPALLYEIDQRLNKGVRLLENTEISHFRGYGEKVRAYSSNRSLGVFDKVVMATGFDRRASCHSLLVENVPMGFYDSEHLLIAENLELKENLFVTGALARPILGAAAANIYGAQMSARLILQDLG